MAKDLPVCARKLTARMSVCWEALVSRFFRMTIIPEFLPQSRPTSSYARYRSNMLSISGSEQRPCVPDYLHEMHVGLKKAIDWRRRGVV